MWGEVEVPAAKNAVLPHLAASVMIEDEVTLLDCPHLADVDAMLRLLRGLGVKVSEQDRTITLSACGNIDPYVTNGTDVMRSSLFLLGPLLARTGEAVIGLPGGCVIGARPIDIHLAGLRALGVEVEERADRVICRVKREVGGTFRLPYPSVGATINLICLATRARDPVTLHNVALEPEVADLIAFLLRCGVYVRQFGRTIEIYGKPKRGVRYRPVSDRIWAGTVLGAVAVTSGEVTLRGISPDLLDDWIGKIHNKCCQIQTSCDTIRVSAWGNHLSRHFVTAPYPGFATDLMAMASVYDATAEGVGSVRETVFESRFAILTQLSKMGVRSSVSGDTAWIKGGRLHGAEVVAPDLRAGAALVVAALSAQGDSLIHGVELVDRGYERFENTLTSLGAHVVRTDER